MSSSLPGLHELRFEIAAEHHTMAVPLAAPNDRVVDVRARLVGHRFHSACVVAVCDADGRLGDW